MEKGKEGNGNHKSGKGKGKDEDKKDNGEGKASSQTDDTKFAGECGYCGKWRHEKSPMQEAQERPGRQTSGIDSPSS